MSYYMEVRVHMRTARDVWQPVSPLEMQHQWAEILEMSRAWFLREAWSAGQWWTGQNADLYAILTGIVVSGVDLCGEPYASVSPKRELPTYGVDARRHV